MSTLWRRALRLAQANINDIKERATGLGRGRTLEEMSDAELEAELERRRREHAARAAVDRARGVADSSGAKRSTSSNATTREGEVEDSALDLFDLSPKERRQVRQYYANLELPFGASLDEVTSAYRRLMRQYHPDKHQADPARRELATQLSQKLTVAYNELKKLLRKKKM